VFSALADPTRRAMKPGGLWLAEMQWNGKSSYQKIEYVEIDPPSRLVWLHSTTDADWNVTSNPRMPDWPRTLLTTVTFEPDGARTRMRLTWAPHEASQAEIDCFRASLNQMGTGWVAGMDLLDGLLAELQA
jgi:uncharacterized protein YndB with AHSA1/START domain